MRVNEYLLLSDCVERGVISGLRRYDEYAEVPLTDEQRYSLREHMEQQVMYAICEYFKFPVDTPCNHL